MVFPEHPDPPRISYQMDTRFIQCMGAGFTRRRAVRNGLDLAADILFPSSKTGMHRRGGVRRNVRPGIFTVVAPAAVGGRTTDVSRQNADRNLFLLAGYSALPGGMPPGSALGIMVEGSSGGG